MRHASWFLAHTPPSLPSLLLQLEAWRPGGQCPWRAARWEMLAHGVVLLADLFNGFSCFLLSLFREHPFAGLHSLARYNAPGTLGSSCLSLSPSLFVEVLVSYP